MVYYSPVSAPYVTNSTVKLLTIEAIANEIPAPAHPTIAETLALVLSIIMAAKGPIIDRTHNRYLHTQTKKERECYIYIHT